MSGRKLLDPTAYLVGLHILVCYKMINGSYSIKFTCNVGEAGVGKAGRKFFVVLRNLLSLPCLVAVTDIAGIS